MSRSRRPRKRKGCVGPCRDDGFLLVNRQRLCHSCALALAKAKRPAIDPA